jgi:hypothetical protein
MGEKSLGLEKGRRRILEEGKRTVGTSAFDREKSFSLRHTNRIPRVPKRMRRTN